MILIDGTGYAGYERKGRITNMIKKQPINIRLIIQAKKIIAIVLLILFSFYSYRLYTYAQLYPEKVCDFDTTRVLVVISHKYSVEKHDYSPEDFSKKHIDSITPIMLYAYTETKDSCYNKENFCDILSLELKSPSTKNVEEVLRILSQIDFVKTAFKNYYYSPDTIILPSGESM